MDLDMDLNMDLNTNMDSDSDSAEGLERSRVNNAPGRINDQPDIKNSAITEVERSQNQRNLRIREIKESTRFHGRRSVITSAISRTPFQV